MAYMVIRGTLGCDWEDEHGLEIVIKNGLTVCKVEQFDGHFTNGHAYGKKKWDKVIYVPSIIL